MKINLSDHFTYGKLFRFTLPSIAMMLFTSIYGVVDGYFVSNFAGSDPFTAINLIMPFLMVLGTIGFMFGAGGSALIGKTLGEGDGERASRIFSLLVYFSFSLAVVIAALGIIFIRPVAVFLGADDTLLNYCVTYGRIILCALPFFVMQMEFQSFFIVAEKPQLGLFVTLAAGFTNMILDALLVGVFKGGLVGAAVATAVSQAVGGTIPLIYFALKNSSLLRFTKTKFDGGALIRTVTNGASEFMSNISMSLVGMLYNFQLLKYAGNNGVAAYGVIMYVSFIFAAMFIGYSVGTAPIVSFHFGAGNHEELRSLRRKSMLIVGIASLAMTSASLLLASPLSKLYVGYDAELFDLTRSGFLIFSFAFLFMGYAIWSSGFFTALNDGITSAIISFMRTVVFQIAAVIILPIFFDVDGIWWSIVAAELMAVFSAGIFLIAKRHKFKY